MAKNVKKNPADGFFTGVIEDFEKPVETNVEESFVKQKENTTETSYNFKQEETRSKRIQILVKPSTNSRIDELVNRGVVKSKNDLINVLLENYLNNAEKKFVEVYDGTFQEDGEFRGQTNLEEI